MTWTTLIRVSGLVALGLLIADVALGVLITGGVARRIVNVKQKQQAHVALGVLLVLAIITHVSAILGSHYLGWTYKDIFETGTGTSAHSAGVIALYLIALVAISTALKRWIPVTVWRTIHHTVPFAALALVVFHGLYAGTDAKTLRIILPAVFALTLLVSIFIVRSSNSYARKKQRKVPLIKKIYYYPLLYIAVVIALGGIVGIILRLIFP